MCHLIARRLTPASVHGEVLEQWPRMFQILSLFRTFLRVRDARSHTFVLVDSKEETPNDSGETAQPQTLVRIPIEDLEEPPEGQRR